MSQPAATFVLPAAGRGSRLGGELPKQYRLLGDRPLLRHTLERLQASPSVQGIVLVVRPEDLDRCRAAIGHPVPGKLRELVPGGAERWESVLAGLRATTSEDPLVAVHDAVRPLFSEALLSRVVAAAQVDGAAVPGLPVRETIKVVDQGKVKATPERAGLWSIQTPQVFRRELLLAAYEAAGIGPAPTDDASLVERLGHLVTVVPGEEQNLKITTPGDLAWAEWYLARQRDGAPALRRLRVGQGYDVHRLEAGRRLVLGGVTLEFDRGLAGHSDADVLTHAVIDALLGAAGAGDIGRLFPDSDPQYRGISSILLLERVIARLAGQGAILLHVDVVVMAQRPRLAPHIPSMVAALAGAMAVEASAVSVKATTTEGLGFVGREEGIAAQAVALLEI